MPEKFILNYTLFFSCSIARVSRVLDNEALHPLYESSSTLPTSPSPPASADGTEPNTSHWSLPRVVESSLFPPSSDVGRRRWSTSATGGQQTVTDTTTATRDGEAVDRLTSSGLDNAMDERDIDARGDATYRTSSFYNINYTIVEDSLNKFSFPESNVNVINKDGEKVVGEPFPNEVTQRDVGENVIAPTPTVKNGYFTAEKTDKSTQTDDVLITSHADLNSVHGNDNESVGTEVSDPEMVSVPHSGDSSPLHSLHGDVSSQEAGAANENASETKSSSTPDNIIDTQVEKPTTIIKDSDVTGQSTQLNIENFTEPTRNATSEEHVKKFEADVLISEKELTVTADSVSGDATADAQMSSNKSDLSVNDSSVTHPAEGNATEAPKPDPAAEEDSEGTSGATSNRTDTKETDAIETYSQFAERVAMEKKNDGNSKN